MIRPLVRSDEVVSARAYAAILGSKLLQEQVLPEGLVTSPYEILDYSGTLVLHDRQGKRATFHRTQKVRFQQSGVSAILDHYWGDGIRLTHYQHSAGPITASLHDGDKNHLVIGLSRAQCTQVKSSPSRSSARLAGPSPQSRSGWRPPSIIPFGRFVRP
jgi:hypothetical protein